MIRTLLALLIASLFAACAPLPNAGGTAGSLPTDKRIALTFDDVPPGSGAFFGSEERTRRIIAHLKAAKVPQAAYFLNPGMIERRLGAASRIERYVAAGNVIANHSNTHPHLNQSDAAAYLADIDAAESWLKGREGYRPNELFRQRVLGIPNNELVTRPGASGNSLR